MNECGRTGSSYTNHGCRCEACRAENTRRVVRRRQERLEARQLVGGRLIAPLPDEKHGIDSTYQNHGCRCRRCTDAHAHAHGLRYHNRKRRAA